MGLLDYFSEKPKIEREPVLRDREQILAYFEQLMRVGAPILVRVGLDDSVLYTARMDYVREEKASLVLTFQNRPAREPQPGTVVHLWFTLDGLRFQAAVRFLNRGGYMQSEFALPECIQHAERRDRQRARFTPRESAEVIAIQGLVDGVGVSGLLLNLSLGGCSFRVDKAMDIARDRRVAPRNDLLPAGTHLPILRLQNLPQTPLIEATGQVRHCSFRGDGLVIGLSFESMGGLEFQAIERLLARRLPGFAPGFPHKRRLGHGEDEETSEEEALLEGALAEEAQTSTAALEELEDAALEANREAIRSPEKLIQLKKRSRGILVVMGDELERAALIGSLVSEGYRAIHEARGLVQALDLSRRNVIQLVILSQQVGPHGALEVVDQLRSSGRAAGTGFVILKDVEDVRLQIAAKAGKVSLVVPRPLDFAGILHPGIARLLGCAG